MIRVQVTVPDGTEIVLVAGVDALWHLPREGEESLDRRTLCGLRGPVYVAGTITRTRRCCQVCQARAPKGLLKRPRKPGAKRRGLPCKITEPQLRALHHLHWEQRVPINELGRRYWQRFGYKSAQACGNAISHHFRKFGWQTHDRIEMTVAASTKNGLSARDWKQRKAVRAAAGLTQKGKERQPRCARCTRPAQHGADFCFSHDPARAGQRAEMTARMRARSPLHDPARLEAAAPLAQSLRDYHSAGGTWRALAANTGIPEHWLSHVAHDDQAQVDRGRAQRIRAALASEAIAA